MASSQPADVASAVQLLEAAQAAHNAVFNFPADPDLLVGIAQAIAIDRAADALNRIAGSMPA